MSCPIKKNNINFCGGANDSKGDIQVILYHADWCGHCNTYIGGGEWQKLQNLASNLPVKFMKYEEKTKEAQDASNKGLIKGWPTIIIMKGGGPMQYKGSRDSQEVLKFLSELLGETGGSTNESLEKNKYSKLPTQCGGGMKNFTSKNEDHYKTKYLKYKAKYMLEKSKI
ncbi:MAG: thioredoxin domain-containing protein [Nitrososphaeraceae archaeon]|nr:thioredoxin domain-containing protein [Nitrososphaeraceae archaeon]